MSLSYTLDSPVLWALVCIQIVLGIFDILYHHEFTERLPWRNTAQTELCLHAVRNLFYAIIFGLFAWWQPQGMYALALGGLIIAEAFITLWDFVEEDKTRALPASERLTHTLLALNYGAIMAFLLPALWQLSSLETQMASIHYDDYYIGNAILSLAAFGCLIFTLRDFAMSAHGIHLMRSPAASLATSLKTRHRIVVTGGTGFVGSRLINALTATGHAVIVLTRHPEKTNILKPPFTVVTNLDQIPAHLPIDAIINLAGAPVAKAWSENYKKVIINSRLQVSEQVEKLIKRLDHKPKLLIGASAIGFYGVRGDEWCEESDPGRPAFTHDVTDAAELANERAAYRQTRLVNLRIGLVLGYEGSMLQTVLPVFDWGLGGKTGDGQQWMSWIERDDLVRLIFHIINTQQIAGSLNAVSPNPVRNAEFAKTLGTVMKRPAVFPVPAFMVKLLFGQMGKEILLSGQRVSAKAVLASGFTFTFPTLRPALIYATGKQPADTKTRAQQDGQPTAAPLPLGKKWAQEERKI